MVMNGLNVQSVSRIKKSVVIEDAALLLNRYVMPGHRIAIMDDNKRREGIKNISKKKKTCARMRARQKLN